VTPADGGTASFTSAWRHYLVLANFVNSPAVFVCPSDSKKIPAKDFTASANGLGTLQNQAIGYYFATELRMDEPRCILSGDAQVQGASGTCIGISVGLPPIPVIKIGYAGGGWSKAVHDTGAGNLLFTDGTVRMVDDAGLHKAITALQISSIDGDGSGCAMVPAH
jgi:hypothetical protein